MNSLDLSLVLAGYRYSWASESDVQRGISRVLDEHGVSYQREARLSDSDRVDFLVGNVAVEVKIGGSRSALLRQLKRYAEHECVNELLVVSTRCQLSCLPPHMDGKPVHSVVLLSSML